MRSVCLDVELLAEGGYNMLAATTTRSSSRTDQVVIQGSTENLEVGGQTWTDTSDSRGGRRILSLSGTWSRVECARGNAARGDGTGNTKQCNSSHHCLSRLGKPRNTTRCDTQRNGAAFMRTTTSAPPFHRNCFPKLSSSQHA